MSDDQPRGTVISLVAAVAENGVIGADGGLPWRLSSDLKRFKRDTMGKPIVMGRKTYQSIGKALPGRTNIVVTRRDNFDAPDIEVAGSIDMAIDIAEEAIAAAKGNADRASEICVIGGGDIYRQFMPLAGRLYITRVLTRPEGDTHFPEIDAQHWTVVHRESVPAGEKDDVATEYMVYERDLGV